jgi:hypothetical protein
MRSGIMHNLNKDSRHYIGEIVDMVNRNASTTKGWGRMKIRQTLSMMLAVLATVALASCSSGGGGGGAANFIIALFGGDGHNGTGGNGGGIESDAYFDINYSRSGSGSVDTKFDVPSAPQLDLGTTSLTVSADTTIGVVDGADPDPVTGTPYMVLGDTNLYISDGNGTSADETPVSGLRVNAGVTLTLALNENWNGNSGQDHAQLNFNSDVDILGTVTTKDLTTGSGGGATVDQRHGATATARDRGGLEINAAIIHLGSSGLVDTSGDDASVTNNRGGDGGDLYLYANDVAYIGGSGSINASGGNGQGTGIGGWGAVGCDGCINSVDIRGESTINKAAITASGGDGATGGEPGNVYLYADNSIYNTGDITKNGGNGSAGSGGGVGSQLQFYANMGSVFNSGDLSANGGNGGGAGPGANGGSAYAIYLYAGDEGWIGDLFNSGSLSANGGNSGDDGAGGNGGLLYFNTYGGDIRTDGAMTANGGTANGTGSTGGSGGALDFYNDYGCEPFASFEVEDCVEVAPGPILVTNNLSLTGGGGHNGGSGGEIYAENGYSEQDARPTGTINFLGYGGHSFKVNGGNGTTGGGSGGYVEAYTYSAYLAEAYFPAGAISNDVDVEGQGGDTTTGSGGHGGWFELTTDLVEYGVNVGTTTVANAGDVDVSGGTGASGGFGGGIFLYGHDQMENHGAINAAGGVADGASGFGGLGADYDIVMASSYDAQNTGAITAPGGPGTGADASGGNGADQVGLFAGGISKNTANILANGGNGIGTGTNGSGGEIEIDSQQGPTDTSGTLNVAPGTGGTVGSGSNGDIIIDFADVTPTDGTLP